MAIEELDQCRCAIISATEPLLLQLLEIKTKLFAQDADPPRTISPKTNPNKRQLHLTHKLIPSRCRHDPLLIPIQLAQLQHRNRKIRKNFPNRLTA